MIASRDGIYAASRFLRHADIQVTAAHYADMKKRVAVDIGALLPPKNREPFSSEKVATKETASPTKVRKHEGK